MLVVFKFLFFFILPSLIIAQEQIQIVDVETNEGVPFATVGSVSGLGVVTDSNGKFSVDHLDGDVFVISCLGYESDTLSRPELEDQIFLKPLSIVLEPIVISDDRAKLLRLGVPKKRGWSSFGVSNSFQIGLLIPNPDQKRLAVDEISIHVMPGFSGDQSTLPVNSFFRLRIYENKDGIPGNDLLLQNVIINPDNNKGWTDVNVERYGILIPEEGFFVAIEWLEETPAVEYERKVDGKRVVRNDFGSSIRLHKAAGTEMKFMVSKDGETWVDWVSHNMKHGDITFPGIALYAIEF